jgi:4-amino-4-deoxy-L-arabinose transferase-like glycosyltransferase
MSYAFTRLVAEMGGSKNAQLLGLIIISFHPLMGDYRSGIMRDSGLWAFMLLALLELMFYSKTENKIHQIKWFFFICIAVLFRVEAFLIAVFTPLSLMFIQSDKDGFDIKKPLIFLLTPASLFLVVVAAFLLSSSVPLDSFKPFVELESHYIQFFSNIRAMISEKSTYISDNLLSRRAKNDAPYALLAVFFTSCFLNIFRAVTPVYAIALIYHKLSSSTIEICKHSNVLIKAHLVVISVYLFLFTISRQFNLERYSFVFVVLILLYLPFIIEKIWVNNPQSIVVRVIIILVLSGYALDTIINSDYKKRYINESAIWLKNDIAENTKIFSNHHHIAYINGKEIDIGVALEERRRIHKQIIWSQGIVYAYHAKAKDEAVLRKRIKSNRADIVKEFRGQDKGVVIVFKLPEQSDP